MTLRSILSKHPNLTLILLVGIAMVAVLTIGVFGEMQIQNDFADMDNNWSCSKLLDFIINVEETDSFVHTEKAIKVWVAHECYN